MYKFENLRENILNSGRNRLYMILIDDHHCQHLYPPPLWQM